MNGAETCKWAQPAVPENRKRILSKKTIERLSASKFCPKCALQGFCSPFHLFQISDDEALLMCKNPDCTFMPSSNWESLIVKRSISDLSVRSSKKSTSSSVSSHLSTKSARNTQSIVKRISRPVTRSSYSSCVSTSAASSQSLPQPKTQGGPASNDSLLHRYLQDSSVDGRERRTLVPLGPFLSGHAHSFSSFETSRLEQKLLQQRVVQQNPSAPSASAQFDNRKITIVTNKRPLTLSGPAGDIKKRACSLDSDSWSSCGSPPDSRPTTPLPENPDGKKVCQIVVPPATLSKLLEGSMTIEIRKSDKSGADVVFRAVKQPDAVVISTKKPHTASTGNKPLLAANISSKLPNPEFSDNKQQKATNIYSAQPHTASTSNNKIETTNKSSQQPILGPSGNKTVRENASVLDQLSSESCVNPGGEVLDSCGLEITEIGPLDIISSVGSSYKLPTTSDSVKSHIEAINFKLQSNSIKSHVEAINAHIEAIKNAVGCSDPGLLVNFSDLCHKFGVDLENNPVDSQINQESQWVNLGSDLNACSDLSLLTPCQSIQFPQAQFAEFEDIHFGSDPC